MEIPYKKSEYHGYTILSFREISSTNSVAREYLNNKMVITAERQTLGRGRLGRTWLNTDGALLMSVVIESSTDSRHIPLYGLAASLAVKQTLDDYFSAGIKWPNDIITNEGKKLCGILSECVFINNDAYAIIGIGINTDASEMPNNIMQPASSLYLETGERIDKRHIMESILDKLDCLVGEKDFGAMRDIYRRSCATIGRRVCVRYHSPEKEQNGIAEDIDDEGRLIVTFEGDGKEALSAADVSIRW